MQRVYFRRLTADLTTISASATLVEDAGTFPHPKANDLRADRCKTDIARCQNGISDLFSFLRSIVGRARMDPKDLKSFIAVAEACGFRRAAQQLGVEQSALSRRISNLEDEVGVSLFERHRGGVRLTVAGLRFLEDVRIVFSHLEAAFRTVRAAGYGGEGTLKIGIVASISSSFLNALLRTYRRGHAKVAMEIIEGEPRGHIADVVGRVLDVAFLTGTPQPQGCDAEQLWHEPILAALASDDPRSAFGVLNLADMSEDQFIVSRVAPGPEIHDYIVQRLARLGFSPRIDHHRVAREGLMAMVGLGFGVTLISGAEAGVTYPMSPSYHSQGRSSPLAPCGRRKTTIPHSGVF